MVALPLPVPPPIGEQRVIFHNLTWDAYQQVLHALGTHRSARLIYDCGTLEITMPLEAHEFYSELIGRFIYFLVSEMGLKLKSMGSTTLDREDLEKGAEPDKAYYIQNQPKVAGKTVDLSQDPPPDLVVEIDITHTDIDKLALYARMGVLEFWRYDGNVWRIYELVDNKYRQVEVSPTFSFMLKEKLYEFLEQAQLDEIEAEKTLRQWIKKSLKSNTIN
ncbi:MAG: Uma2 family endonuclease [Cyanobacteria bacterium P01_C01_bin.118]